MSRNPKKKLIIESSSGEKESIPSEVDNPVENIEYENKRPGLTMADTSSDHTSDILPPSPNKSSSGSSSSSTGTSSSSIGTSSSSTGTSTSSTGSKSSTSVPSTSSSVPSTSTGIIGSDITSSLDKNQLQDEFERLNCNDENFFTSDCNKFLLKKEFLEREYLSDHENEDDYLYPNLNDKEFNIKIATKKEFNDSKYDGSIFEDIKKQSDILAKADFELQPHQAFVKNFMSFQTPYSSLLLYHGLGSGKTCSAIGVCEEMRDYMKQMGITKRIIIIASENVQDNFKLQLFDERKLKQINGIWSMRGCIGNKLLKEINPMNMPMPKEKVISQIKNLINTYYIFLGYVQFANYIIKTMNYEEEAKKKFERKKICKGTIK
jgi:hypothetical protein